MIFQDWEVNDEKGRLVMMLFRIGQKLRLWPAWLAFPYHVFYRVVVEWLMGIELRTTTKVGPGLRIFHGVGLVVHDATVIGSGCTLRQNTTIGSRHDGGPCPVLEDGVDVGANAVVLGGIRVGRGAVIGAGAVVIKDVPAGAVVAGNPARVVKQKSAE